MMLDLNSDVYVDGNGNDIVFEHVRHDNYYYSVMLKNIYDNLNPYKHYRKGGNVGIVGAWLCDDDMVELNIFYNVHNLLKNFRLLGPEIRLCPLLLFPDVEGAESR